MLRPVDMKVAILTSDDVSKMRENQKTQEAGLAEQVSQNKHNQENRTDTVQNVQNAEGNAIRKEDEQNSKGNPRAYKTRVQKKDKKPEEPRPIQDGIHGLLDLKA